VPLWILIFLIDGSMPRRYVLCSLYITPCFDEKWYFMSTKTVIVMVFSCCFTSICFFTYCIFYNKIPFVIQIRLSNDNAIINDISKDCPVLPDIDNGHVTFTDNTRYTSVAIYSCDDGFRLSSPDGRYCQMDGKWSDIEPTCDRCEATY